MEFKRGKSSIEGLALGGYLFETLKEGAILRTKKYFGISKTTGNLRGYTNSAIQFTINQYLVIHEIKDSVKLKHKELYFRKYYTLVGAQNDKKALIVERNLYGISKTTGYISEISYAQFNNRFEIIDN